MKSANLVFPHQLFERCDWLDNGHDVYLVEEHLYFTQYPFHKNKLAFHRATMTFYETYLARKKRTVHYVEATSPLHDIRNLIPHLKSIGVSDIHCVDPVDDWLERRLAAVSKQQGVTIVNHDSPQFLNTSRDIVAYFDPAKKRYSQTHFYVHQRKALKMLVDPAGRPMGGKWSFDPDNRQKYPKGKQPPKMPVVRDPLVTPARDYVDRHFKKAVGSADTWFPYPATFQSARRWLRAFLTERLPEFGAYEDAIVWKEDVLHHSVLSPLLNAGLLTPAEVVNDTIAFAQKNKIPLNSLEGFLRQIIGWREFIRGVYVVKGRQERTRNFWGFSRKMPPSFYTASTGIFPMDAVIQKVLKTGYCHHIERLMVLGNFMLLCELDPNDVYRWFMEFFVDAYDWVMVPNVYGMSQFADGGVMSTKPYISGSHYLMRMSDYPTGDWQDTWDALFWRFLHVHRDFFLKNPRLSMLVKTFDKMPVEKRNRLLTRADTYLARLDKHT